jgi:DNA-binding transcriptional LysR family regulator
MKVSLKQLEILHAVAVAGSISRAMRRLEMSQPNISQQLAKMEEALGTQLLVRGRSLRTELTPAGSFWAEAAARILGKVEATEAQHHDLFVERGVTINLGTTPSFCGPFNEAVARLAADLPRLSRFELTSAPTSQDLVELLMTHRIGIALLRDECLEEHRTSLHVLPAHEDRIVWAVPESVPDATVRAVLGGAPIPTESGCLARYAELRAVAPWFGRTQDWYASALPGAHPFFGCTTHESAVRIVAAGLATCHTPSSIILNLPDEVRRRVRFYDIGGPGRAMGLAMPRHLNSVRPFHDFAEALAAMLRAEYAPGRMGLLPLPQTPRGR